MLVVGEALVDVVLTDGGTIDAPGGSPLNVAVGLARLGVPATLLTQLAQDDRGALLRDYLATNGVELIDQPTSTGRTAVGIARLDAAGVATYEFDLEWSLPPQPLPPTTGVHVGSLGATLAPGREAVRSLAEEAAAAGRFVSYDPNLRPQFIPADGSAQEWVRALADLANLVKLSEEDCELLGPGTRAEDVARELLHGSRTQLVLLTQGGEGATAYVGGEAIHAPAPRIDVVDTVGAGDAFMAAVLAQLHDLDVLSPPLGEPGELTGEALQRVVAGAAVVAALTCARRGAAPPRRQELPSGWPG